MAPVSPFGSPVPPGEALAAVGNRLAEWYHAIPGTDGRRVRLLAAVTDLPDATLSFERERRLFSRTRQLVVESEAPGRGPSDDGTLVVRARRLRRRFDVEWLGSTAEERGEGRHASLAAGLAAGARTMTNVRELSCGWSASERRWRLRLVTLAGALIGTSPVAAVAVPLEPEDVDGLLAVLRAFKAGAAGSRRA